MTRAILASLLATAVLLGLSACATPMPDGPFRSQTLVLDQPTALPGPASGPLPISTTPPGVLLEPNGSGEPGRVSLVSSPLAAPFPFSEALVSWNLAVPPGMAARIEMRVARDGPDGVARWSPWLFLGRWGGPDAPEPDREARTLAFDALAPDAGGEPTPARGKIDVDFFVSDESFDRAQLRVSATRDAGTPTPEPGTAVRVERLAITFSDTTAPIPLEPGTGQRAELPVPFRSQRTPNDQLSGRLCSPTSVAMVLAFRGVDRPVADVADTAYDHDHDIFGNWPRNIQAAYSMGVPGYLTRFDDWASVEATLAAGKPIIASIQVKPGELKGAPYPKTAGHLIVIRGIDQRGNLIVNDPAAGTPDTGMLTYRRKDMERVWLRRTAGTAYVLLDPATPAPTGG